MAAKKNKANSPTAARRVTSVMREAEALRWRALRMSYRSIGERLGVNGATACRLVQRALGRLKGDCAAMAEQVRQLDLQALDHMQERLIPGIERGDCPSVLAALKCVEVRGRLIGTFAATKTENKNENENTNRSVSWLTRAEMITELQRARERAMGPRGSITPNERR
ncbi:MAG TPA: hypothetical protein VGG64_21045 [Pirellulales bacterium]|jgi:hypothetical protein